MDMSEGPFRRVRVEEVVVKQTGEWVEVKEAGVAHGWTILWCVRGRLGAREQGSSRGWTGTSSRGSAFTATVLASVFTLQLFCRFSSPL